MAARIGILILQVSIFTLIVATCASIFTILPYNKDDDSAIASEKILFSEIDIINGGFRDLRWGRHISDCDDMVYESHNQTSGGNVKIYNRKNEKLNLDNNIKLSKIEYGFLNSRLLFVALKTNDPQHQALFKQTVLLKFGDDKKNEISGNLYWDVNSTSVIFQPANDSKPSILMLISKDGLSSNFSK